MVDDAADEFGQGDAEFLSFPLEIVGLGLGQKDRLSLKFAHTRTVPFWWYRYSKP
jgi:hypothetical protein